MMIRYKIIEKFVSIDGEGPMAGGLATFIRFENCNLQCNWCDTAYAWNSPSYEEMSADDILAYIESTGVKRVTLTGGEPLIQEGIEDLLLKLSRIDGLLVHIETNGSVAIQSTKATLPATNIRYIVDYKLPDSGMTDHMDSSNLTAVGSKDVYKFVVASIKDLSKAREIIQSNQLDERCRVYISPVSNRIAPTQIIEYMKQHKMHRVRFQLQMHKIIWSPDTRGV